MYPPYTLLLRKGIPFAKMYIDNSENLTPGVNQFPHCHSVETETHIHFCPKAGEIFDLPGFSRHQNDCSTWPVLTISQNPVPLKSPLFTGFFALSFAKLFVFSCYNILWFLHIFPCQLCKISCQQTDCFNMHRMRKLIHYSHSF